MSLFTQHLHIPAPLALLAFSAEFFGGLGLVAGLLTRLAAFGIAVDMVVAVFAFHLRNGFFMNWLGEKDGQGFEYHVLAIAMGIDLMIRGAGAVSLDFVLSRPRA